jgi:hypothetical protein
MFTEPSKNEKKKLEFSFCATPKTLLIPPACLTEVGVEGGHAIYVVERKKMIFYSVKQNSLWLAFYSKAKHNFFLYI